jgi:hypothetical protein|nr:MAG TPA: hypothetical protein [Caudoviricetes sp.]
MCVSSDFDDTVKICEFYSGDDLPIEVDYENRFISLGGYVVDPVMEDGHLVMYFVDDPEGVALFVSDLDDYFQERLPDWREEL